MKPRSGRLKMMTLFLAARPKHLVVGAAPVIVGSCLGYATLGSFNVLLFVLALLSIILLQAGANMANDYFDHVSGNDWANKNPTPFSGGSRFIQQGLLSPRAMLLAALAALAFGCALGVVIFLIILVNEFPDVAAAVAVLKALNKNDLAKSGQIRTTRAGSIPGVTISTASLATGQTPRDSCRLG
jgi:1,4-dihydroxy-2-naphthoate octaprenyltransferase